MNGPEKQLKIKMTEMTSPHTTVKSINNTRT